MTEDTKTTKKPLRKRSTSTLKGKTAFQIANESLLRLYEITINVLKQAIQEGSVDMPLGLFALMVYTDILHGGAYACPVNQLPYYLSDPTKSPYYAGALNNTQANEGFLGWLIAVLGLTNPGNAVHEILVDANCPHIFPKLLSDEAYAAIKILFSQVATTDVFKSVGTGVKTYVEAAHEAAKIPGEFMPSGEQLQALAKLIPTLVTAAGG
jgi:hypothetical protein